jgi:sortase A
MAKIRTPSFSRNIFRTFFTFFVLILGIFSGIYVIFTVLSPALVELPIAREFIKQPEAPRSSLVKDDRLYIPQIGVNVAIVTGDTEEALTKGAWHRKPENGNPQEGGNFVLSAHRFVMSWTPGQTVERSPFYNIGKLNIGDQLQVDYRGIRYSYAITKKFKVDPNQTEIESRSDESKMTLYSCTLRGSTDGRDVIEAKIIK